MTDGIKTSQAQKILDAVALVAFVDPLHPLHDAGKKYLSSLITDAGVFIPSTSIIELDLVLKGAEFKFRERKEIFDLLIQVIPVSESASPNVVCYEQGN